MYADVNNDHHAVQKPNSMNNFFEVSGHNLESSQDLRFLDGFLKPYSKEGSVVFLFSPFKCTVTQ